jgi:uncharacterized Zn finger protein
MAIHNLSEASLYKISYATDFELGQTYAQTNQVHGLVTLDNTVAGTVATNDGNRYRAKIWNDHHHSIEFACTCPQVENEGKICCHCIAIALAYLHSDRVPMQSLQHARDFMMGKDLQWVVEWIMERSLDNEQLCKDLLLEPDL